MPFLLQWEAMVQGVGGSGGEGVEGLAFGFGSVWLRDLGMQLCFGFGSDVFAKLHIYLIKYKFGQAIQF